MKIKRLITFALAVIVFIPLCVTGFIYHFISGGGGRYFLHISSAMSQIANAFSGKLLNKIMIKKGAAFVRFGNEDETISGVLGKNAELDTLSLFGRFIRRVLNTADPDHTEKAIELDE